LSQPPRASAEKCILPIDRCSRPRFPLTQIAYIESEIREALTNLVLNAVDAMPQGGRLTLRTSVAGDGSDAGAGGVPRRVQVEVIDTGLGMDEETRRRCLEPFYTTKGERGTGLGLAMVYGMVERHSAEIEIESALGKGTTVCLGFALPATDAEAGSPAAAVDARPPQLRILLVDDDPLLLKSLRDTLGADGHTIVTASGGHEGMDVFAAALARGERIDVVITDLGMPYMDGRQVATAVRRASPSTPVILLTGWGQRLAADGDIPPNVDRLVSKPPKLRELREALAHCATLSPPQP
jgi:CheY-like chemotaxis protein/anti-sigma regulatory factor (Ser/Thr protein kinase)